MKATIYDVAKEAGVSIATVSKVLNGKGKISVETREAILAIMDRLDYQPSVIASALTGKRTFTLGLLVPDISNPFFSEIARAIEDQGEQLGYSVMMCSTDNKDEKVERYIALLQQKKVDGIIIATGIDNKEILEQLLSKGIPVVLLARDMPLVAVNTVVVDDYVGGCLAASHLLELGHRRIGIIGEREKVRSSRERVRGFRQTMEEYGAAFVPEHLKHCDYKVEDGKIKALELLQADEPPTAIFACNDMLAVGTLQAARELGKKVPEDLSIVSFDNTILAAVTDPPLTTVAQPMEHMGKLVVNLIVEELQGTAPVKQRTVLRPELITRESTAAIVS
ncbi:LacI family DNA-binding transcriptional regulator [Paenibacillus sedimenti]|uniref:LacI family DNA-binding transcriptional regulator n=1 Tax=Paenibacillus sedimenti TaxID=2770274 RepID=A0A926QKI5_9BACL|nr:LacI family DNA-binding transcriptional regulator [Paenibacillus sedimenti]MBD0381793.1 LacI family DNA-binding transcriptional regulator [Paenibacillus sedimenti]